MTQNRVKKEQAQARKLARELELIEEARALETRNAERLFELAQTFTIDGKSLGVSFTLDERFGVLVNYLCQKIPGASAAEYELYWERYCAQKIEVAFAEAGEFVEAMKSQRAREELLEGVPFEGGQASPGGLFVPGGAL